MNGPRWPSALHMSRPQFVKCLVAVAPANVHPHQLRGLTKWYTMTLVQLGVRLCCCCCRCTGEGEATFAGHSNVLWKLGGAAHAAGAEAGSGAHHLPGSVHLQRAGSACQRVCMPSSAAILGLQVKVKACTSHLCAEPTVDGVLHWQPRRSRVADAEGACAISAAIPGCLGTGAVPRWARDCERWVLTCSPMALQLRQAQAGLQRAAHCGRVWGEAAGGVGLPAGG